MISFSPLKTACLSSSGISQKTIWLSKLCQGLSSQINAASLTVNLGPIFKLVLSFGFPFKNVSTNEDQQVSARQTHRHRAGPGKAGWGALAEACSRASVALRALLVLGPDGLAVLQGHLFIVTPVDHVVIRVVEHGEGGVVFQLRL